MDDRSGLEALRDKKIEQAKRKREQAEELEADALAIERVLAMLPSAKKAQGSRKGDEGEGELLRDVVLAIAEESGEIVGTAETMAALQERDPELAERTKRPTISSTLRRLYEAGKLDRVQEGKRGNKPSLYRAKSAAAADTDRASRIAALPIWEGGAENG